MLYKYFNFSLEMSETVPSMAFKLALGSKVIEFINNSTSEKIAIDDISSPKTKNNYKVFAIYCFIFMIFMNAVPFH